MTRECSRVLSSVCLVAALAIPAAAQQRSMVSGRAAMPMRARIAAAPRAMTSARVVTVQAPSSMLVRSPGAMVGTTATTSGISTTPVFTPAINAFAPLTVSQLLNPVPGFGFDFRHLAAVNQNLDIMAVIDPVTQQRLAIAERLLRETPVVRVVFPGFASSPVVVVESPPPLVVVQQPAAAEPAAQAPMAAAPMAAPAAAPLPVGDLILVRKDGTRICIAGFTQQGDQIVYITREGERRAIALNDLDRAATVRANEANGTLLHFPS